eukprot:gene15118-16674_t
MSGFNKLQMMNRTNTTVTTQPRSKGPMDAIDMVYVTCLSLIIIVGTTVSALVAMATREKQKESKLSNNPGRRSYHKLMFYTNVIDGFMCASHISTVIMYMNSSLMSQRACSWYGFFYMFLGVVEVSVVFVTALNRYNIATAMLKERFNAWSQRTTNAMLLCSLLFSFIISILPLTPLTKYYITSFRRCYMYGASSTDRVAKSVFMFISTSKTLLTVLSGLVYVLIYIWYRSVQKRIGTSLANDNEQPQQQHQNETGRAKIAKERHLTVVIFSTVVALWITRFSMGTISTVTRSKMAMMVGSVVMYSYNLISPILIGYLNVGYRKKVKRTLKTCLCLQAE